MGEAGVCQGPEPDCARNAAGMQEQRGRSNTPGFTPCVLTMSDDASDRSALCFF